MKLTLVFSFVSTIFLVLFFTQALQAQCGYTMSRGDAVYFAKAQGYSGSGMLPSIQASTLQENMTSSLRRKYEEELPICSYCRKASVLDTWYNDLAVCNAANYYHNLFMSDHNRSIQMMDSEIYRLRSKRN